ncbi:YuzD family protein [Scopulibacillus cellulosilyticus]|uniref:YuzD family protein n=2 Tax=Scopulibacillus cellulosilyticus TaxID=2665665 RepID=A0ABW2PYQ6_9BACL
MAKSMNMTIYGANQPCPSCIHSPSSKETMEWIQASIKRKFPHDDINVRYIDIYHPETEEDQKFAEKIINDEYFYPLVVSNGKVIGEGDPKIKKIFEEIENNGFQSV